MMVKSDSVPSIVVQEELCHSTARVGHRENTDVINAMEDKQVRPFFPASMDSSSGEGVEGSRISTRDILSRRMSFHQEERNLTKLALSLY